MDVVKVQASLRACPAQMPPQDMDRCGSNIRNHSRACPGKTSPHMDVAVALGTTPAPVLHRRLHRTWMDVAKTLGIIPEPALHRCVCRT